MLPGCIKREIKYGQAYGMTLNKNIKKIAGKVVSRNQNLVTNLPSYRQKQNNESKINQRQLNRGN